MYYFDQLGNYQFLKKYCFTCSYVLEVFWIEENLGDLDINVRKVLKSVLKT